MNSLPVVRVAMPTPLRRLFDYLADPAADGAIAAGTRVRVPFGQRRLIGVAMERAAASDLPPERLKRVLERLDPRPIFDPATLALLGWAADYYHHPIGEVLAAALPKALRLGAATAAAEERWVATSAGLQAYAGSEPRRAPRQRQLLAALAPTAAVGLTAAELDARLESWRDSARASVWAPRAFCHPRTSAK